MLQLFDISERKASEEKIRFMALHDNLTNLPNRYLLQDRLQKSLALARRNCHLLALLFIDLNGFKKINDTYGHDVGDLLLKGVSDRLQSILRDTDTLARMGGDEFVILMPQIHDSSCIDSLISRINNALTPPFHFDSTDILSRASIGFAIFPKDGNTEEDLMRAADTNMYKDKETNKEN